VRHRLLLAEQLEREREGWAVARGEMEDLLNRERGKTRLAVEQTGTLEKAIMALARGREERGEGL